MNAGVFIKKEIINASKSVIGLGITAIILGVIALIYPVSIGKFSTIILGILLTIGGGFRFIFAIASMSIGSMFLRYLYAILMTVAGIWISTNPDMGLEVLTIIVAIYFIADGITSLFYSITLRSVGAGIHLLISGILSASLGIMVFSNWDESSEYVLGIYLGIKFILDGVMLALTGSTIQKVNKL